MLSYKTHNNIIIMTGQEFLKYKDLFFSHNYLSRGINVTFHFTHEVVESMWHEVRLWKGDMQILSRDYDITKYGGTDEYYTSDTGCIIGKFERIEMAQDDFDYLISQYVNNIPVYHPENSS